MKKLLLFIVISLIIAGLFAFPCAAETADYSKTEFSVSGFQAPANLSDQNRVTYTEAKEDSTVTLNRIDGIAHLYIEFDRIPNGWTLTGDGKAVDCGKEKFLHDYVDVKKLLGIAPESITLNFPKGTVISDIYGFSAGDLPNFVQIWNPPCEKADLLLISSHSDDEQLFFAGILPYYAVERKLNVQVAYIVQHFEANGIKNHTRPHEQLDGLWTVGVRNYPVMSDFPDVYSESKDREVAFKNAEKAFGAAGVTYDDFKDYITENLRRFQPLVVVSHDLNGEYGHGTHVFCSSALTESIKLAADDSYHTESAKKYGVWQVEKTYLHLYDQNKITMDWDTPFESLGGKTPFQVTQDGFGCHKSQHWTWFKKWLYGKNSEITKASQIKTYSPCEFGLYDTVVGLDSAGGDFMENITSYEERAEAEKKAKEEAEALKKAEEAAKQKEAEALKKAEEAKQKAEEAAKQKAEHKARRTKIFVTLLCAVTIAVGIVWRLIYKAYRK